MVAIISPSGMELSVDSDCDTESDSDGDSNEICVYLRHLRAICDAAMNAMESALSAVSPRDGAVISCAMPSCLRAFVVAACDGIRAYLCDLWAAMRWLE